MSKPDLSKIPHFIQGYYRFCPARMGDPKHDSFDVEELEPIDEDKIQVGVFPKLEDFDDECPNDIVVIYKIHKVFKVHRQIEAVEI